jgi:signal transduction histidine kinase
MTMQRVAHKIWLGCLIIVGIGVVAMLVTYRGLVRVQREMHHLADVHEPLKSAAHEMEINVKGIAIGTLAYLSSPNPKFRELVADAEADFHQFHAQYNRLATEEQQKELGVRLELLFEKFKTQNRELKLRRDRQTVAFTEALAKLEEIDRLFDQQLPVQLDPQRPNYLIKLESISAVDEGIDAIRMRVATYRWSRHAENKVTILQKMTECRAAFERLKEFRWTTEGKAGTVREAETAFEEAMEKVEVVLADEDEIHAGVARFIALRDEIDTLLDDEVQPLAAELLRLPRARTEAMTNSVVLQVGWLTLLFLISAVMVSLALARVVVRPLQSLARGTEVVSQGDLTHRVPVVGGGEFAILAGAFNRMVARLQDTLVSKEILEKSQQELKATVDVLQHEIAERIRAQDEQMRLAASLRRAETLSAMGSLVAGVAHQVRTPLFGISSVLDAMEARLGSREEYRRYMSVLRGEAGRMTTLMHELMEYGRSANVEPSMGSVADVIAEATRTCQRLADTSQVRVEEHLNGTICSVLMDRSGLTRLFQNLLENAIQHSPAESCVTISASNLKADDRDWIEVRVEDCGPGFRKDDLPHIFEPFFTRRPGGTGLGLALVQRTAERHGGQVWAANRSDGGAIFTVRLPVERTDGQIPDSANAPALASNGN